MNARPVVAIVGRPNVGKSSLFNRLARRVRSIVLDTPGVTRDRIYVAATIEGDDRDFAVVLVDTGGFDPSSSDPIMQRVLDQTQLAIDEADVVIFLADGRDGVMPEDHDIARLLRKGSKAVVVGVNKIDGPKQDEALYDFQSLGFPSTFGVSAAHGRNVGELTSAIARMLPASATTEDISVVDETTIEGDDLAAEVGEDETAQADTAPSGPIRIAVIGRPNSGKSSLVNRLLGEDRHLVSDIPGTTVDFVYSTRSASG